MIRTEQPRALLMILDSIVVTPKYWGFRSLYALHFKYTLCVQPGGRIVETTQFPFEARKILNSRLQAHACLRIGLRLFLSGSQVMGPSRCASTPGDLSAPDSMPFDAISNASSFCQRAVALRM